MILSQEEVEKLGKDSGLWRESKQVGSIIYIDPAVEILIRDVEKLILEKLDAAKNL